MQTQILGLITPLMALFFAATFVVLWYVGRLKRHVLGFAISYVLAATGFLLTHFLPAGAFYVFHVTQFFYAAGSIVLIASICERAGHRAHIGSLLGVYGAAALVLAIAVSLSDDVSSRLVIVNAGYGVMFTIGVTTLLNTPRRTFLDNAIIAIMVYQAADFFIRPNLTLLFEQSIPAADYRGSLYYSMIGLGLAVKGVTTAMVLIGAVIAEWMALLRETSERDPLTSLHNRASFEESIRDLLPQARTEGKPLSLVVADIDHFKQVNDIWGHQAGDEAIASFGALIQKTVRGCDTAGRIGGEEFCIAVWNCENAPAERLAERIRQNFARLEHASLSDGMRLTASFGIATAQDGETYQKIFARADEALYRAKSKGRDRVENSERQGSQNVAREATEAPIEIKRAAIQQ